MDMDAFQMAGTKECISIGQKTKLSRLKKKMSSDLTRSEFPPSGKGHKRQRQRNKAKPHNKTEYSTMRWGGDLGRKLEAGRWGAGQGILASCSPARDFLHV